MNGKKVQKQRTARFKSLRELLRGPSWYYTLQRMIRERVQLYTNNAAVRTNAAKLFGNAIVQTMPAVEPFEHKESGMQPLESRPRAEQLSRILVPFEAARRVQLGLSTC